MSNARPPVFLAHRLVKELHKQLIHLGMTRNELARRAGLGRNTVINWYKAEGGIDLYNIEAALGAVGIKLMLDRHSTEPQGPSRRTVRERNTQGQFK